MAKSVTAANKQIARLKAKLTAMKEEAEKKAKARAASSAARRAGRTRLVQPRIAALKTAIAAAEKAMASAGPKTAAALAKRIARMEKTLARLQGEVRHLTVYNVRLLENEKQIGEFGPYATIRAASADAKNILRMHLGPSMKVEGKRINQIEEIGVDEPLMRSDGQVWVYFHPSIYSGQQSGGPVLTAQVVETGGAPERTKTFIVKKPDAKKKKKKVAASTSTQTSLLPNRRRRNGAHYVAVLQDNGGGGAWRFKHEVGVFTSLVAAKRKASAIAADYADAQRGGWKYRVAIYPADARGEATSSRAVAVVNTARTNRR
jgi:hypothetical protein